MLGTMCSEVEKNNNIHNAFKCLVLCIQKLKRIITFIMHLNAWYYVFRS